MASDTDVNESTVDVDFLNIRVSIDGAASAREAYERLNDAMNAADLAWESGTYTVSPDPYERDTVDLM